MDWNMFAGIGVLFTIQTTLLLWMMSKLDSDIKGVADDSNQKWMAVNARADALNARTDTTQGIIMRILESQGK